MAAVICLNMFLDDNQIEQLEKLFDTDEKKYKNAVTKIIQNRKITVKNGDIIQTKEKIYRNETKLIWLDGKCVDLSADYDEYGSVPPLMEFCVLENFPINYWYESVDHNYLVPLNHHTFKEQLLASHKLTENESLTFSVFEFNNVKYTVYFNWEYTSKDRYDLKAVLDYDGIYLYETGEMDFLDEIDPTVFLLNID